MSWPYKRSRNASKNLVRQSRTNALIIGRYQSDLNTFQWTQNNIRLIPMTSPLHPTPLLNRFKLLQYPDSRISHLRQCKVLSETDTWTTVERNVCPGNRGPGFPSRGVEVVNSGSKEVIATLHAHCRVGNGGARCNSNWLWISVFTEGGEYVVASGTTPAGKGGINKRCSAVEWYNGI